MDRDSKGRFIKGEKKINQFGYSIFFTDTEKECRKCKKIKLHSEFHKDKTNKYGLSYWCSECACANGRFHHARRMKEDPEYKKSSSERWIKARYNMSFDEYTEKYKEQKVCSICSVDLIGKGQTHLDHDHKTGKIREFLCTNCNRGLGHFQDSEIFLQNAINYLAKHRENENNLKEGT